MDAGTALSSKFFMTFVVHYPSSSFTLSFHMVPNHLYLTDIVYYNFFANYIKFHGSLTKCQKCSRIKCHEGGH